MIIGFGAIKKSDVTQRDAEIRLIGKMLVETADLYLTGIIQTSKRSFLQ